MFKKKTMLLGLFLGSGLISTVAAAAAWRLWQHPGFRGQNGMLNNTVLARNLVDWAPGYWKAECSGKEWDGSDPIGTKVLQGVSGSGRDGYTEAILCTNSDEANSMGWSIDKFNFRVLNIDNKNDQQGSWGLRGDWAVGSYKGECPDGFAVTGLAQTANQQTPIVKRVLCSKINVPHPVSCSAWRRFTDSRTDWFGASVGGIFWGQDWNFGNGKVSCPANQYVAGVAVDPTKWVPSGGLQVQIGERLSSLLCCSSQ